MPALIPTDHHATVTWLGYVPHRDEAAIETRALDQMTLGWEGYAGDFHSGVTRPSCSRVVSQHPKNTEIRYPDGDTDASSAPFFARASLSRNPSSRKAAAQRRSRIQPPVR